MLEPSPRRLGEVNWGWTVVRGDANRGGAKLAALRVFPVVQPQKSLNRLQVRLHLQSRTRRLPHRRDRLNYTRTEWNGRRLKDLADRMTGCALEMGM